MNRMWKMSVLVSLALMAGCGSKASCPKGTVDQGGRCVESTADADVDEDAASSDACVGDACAPKCVTETCNDKDDDCDGLIDEGVQAFGPTQAVEGVGSVVVTVLPWKDHFIVFSVDDPLNSSQFLYREYSVDGEPVAPPQTILEAEDRPATASLVGDVLVIVLFEGGTPSAMRLVAYDLVDKKKVGDVNVTGGYYLGFSAVGAADNAKVRIAFRGSATGVIAVRTYALPALQAVDENTYATTAGESSVHMVGGGGDTTLFSAIENTVVAMNEDGSLLTQEFANSDYVIFPSFTPSTDGSQVGFFANFQGDNPTTQFLLLSRNLAPQASIGLPLTQAASLLDAYNSVTQAADGTWYVAYQSGTVQLETAALSPQLARFHAHGATIDQLFFEEIPCSLSECTGVPSKYGLRMTMGVSGNRALVHVKFATDPVNNDGFLVPLGCY